MSSTGHHSASLCGAGVGLRSIHYQTILETLPDIPWFEALTDNYMGNGGLPLQYLEQIREHYPITFHGVGLSLGSLDPLDQGYIKKLKHLINRFKPQWVSDHLCWSSYDGIHGNDLFPMPYSEEALKHMANRIMQVQDALGQRIMVENVSSYVTYQSDEMTEWAFLAEVAKQADCDLLCDVNNIYVSAQNHQFDPLEYLEALPHERIREIHLAGYEDEGTHLLDTHGSAIHDPVWSLYKQVIEMIGPTATLVEWDTNIPSFDVLYSEAKKAAHILEQYHVAA
ncbi:DUF692 domain-containing protein [Alkalimarinus coralli]|uniref:MNIO family bufferin maturase n=1 Tax=Alkalimarinus coralli TaxID=2935863 RepID=UPI00202B8300|nr:DUF692 domain-containing protein [Alkalimarinus coralli]